MQNNNKEKKYTYGRACPECHAFIESMQPLDKKLGSYHDCQPQNEVKEGCDRCAAEMLQNAFKTHYVNNPPLSEPIEQDKFEWQKKLLKCETRGDGVRLMVKVIESLLLQEQRRTWGRVLAEYYKHKRIGDDEWIKIAKQKLFGIPTK